jgi:hypothetical protein
MNTLRTSRIPTVEVIQPRCPCGREVGNEQYGLMGRSSLETFLTERGRDPVKLKPIIDTITRTEEQAKNLRQGRLLCCIRSLTYSRKTPLSIIQTTSSQRTMPRKEEGPLFTTMVLEW